MTDPPRLSTLPEGDPERFSELPEGDPARALFGSLRDMPPPADLTARTLAGLGLLPPPAGPPPSPPAPPAPLAPSGASLLSGALLKPLATSLALLSLAGGAAHVALAPSRPAVTASLAPSAPLAASAPLLAPSSAVLLAPSSAAPSVPLPAAALAAASGEPARVAALTPPSPDLPGLVASTDGQPSPARQPSSGRRDPVAERASEPSGDVPRAASIAPADVQPAPPTAPVATPAASVRPRLDLDRELAALDLARTALAGGSPTRALDAIAAYRAAFPAGQLGAEALLLEIEARMKTGDRATAVQLAEAFLARHPRSVLAARVRSLAGLPATETNP